MGKGGNPPNGSSTTGNASGEYIFVDHWLRTEAKATLSSPVPNGILNKGRCPDCCKAELLDAGYKITSSERHLFDEKPSGSQCTQCKVYFYSFGLVAK